MIDMQDNSALLNRDRLFNGPSAAGAGTSPLGL
jgi:hypothetical protein